MNARFSPLAALAFAVAFAFPGLSFATETEFTVLRDGDTIGWQKFSVETNGDETVVRTTSEVVVKVLFVEAYKFIQESAETYQGGKLVKLVSKTTDDGPFYDLTVTAEGGQLNSKAVKSRNSVAEGENTGMRDGDLLTASLWNGDVVNQSALLNTIDGSVTRIDSVEKLGTDTVSVNGADVSATHYRLNGVATQDNEEQPWTREVWYDFEGNLVQYQFKDSTGTLVQYVQP